MDIILVTVKDLGNILCIIVNIVPGTRIKASKFCKVS